ncbi:MAG: nucleoside 2-deoxyribosyltransferase domain-containing protein [Akkermansiaceae bacterium]|nr:nucleoside 2-deoxyribosyltransferase domain-containing protein [Armatimonadota bacterium]
MTTVLTAPEEKMIATPSLFLAGGISDCGDWQSEMIALLADSGWSLLNPRREVFDVHDATVSEAQIAWEYRYLRQATAVLFWFPPETLCPITLFELGGALERSAPVFVGCHPNFARRDDVRVQVALRRPAVPVVGSLDTLADQAKSWLKPGA